MNTGDGTAQQQQQTRKSTTSFIAEMFHSPVEALRGHHKLGLRGSNDKRRGEGARRNYEVAKKEQHGENGLHARPAAGAGACADSERRNDARWGKA